MKPGLAADAVSRIAAGRKMRLLILAVRIPRELRQLVHEVRRVFSRVLGSNTGMVLNTGLPILTLLTLPFNGLHSTLSLDEPPESG